MNPIQVMISHHAHTDTDVPVVSFPKWMLKKMKIPAGYPIRLRCSNRHIQVVCLGNSAKSSLILMNPDAAQHLGIPDQSQLHIRYAPSSRELRLGPVLAILINQTSDHIPFAPLDTFMKEVIRLARSRYVLAYVVSLSDLIGDQGLVSGWTVSNLKWKKSSFPLPHVVYNRITSRKVERTEAFQTMKQALAAQHIVFFNQTFLNKWEVYGHLKTNEQLARHLPETKRFESYAILGQMLQKYPVVFVKPIHGSLGKGIYRISRGMTGFTSQYTTLNGEIHKQFKSLHSLYQYLSKRIRRKYYIVQQGIPILHLDERAIDFRALMQKNQRGEWAVTSMVARMGPTHRFVSNVARGGEISSVTHILQRCHIPQTMTVRNKLVTVAKKVCAVIERIYQGQFGELGVDLALTKNGHIYILEVNSKPSKTDDSLRPSRAARKGRPSVHRLLDYTLYLTQYDKK